jgi:hypothetical protein
MDWRKEARVVKMTPSDWQKKRIFRKLAIIAVDPAMWVLVAGKKKSPEGRWEPAPAKVDWFEPHDTEHAIRAFLDEVPNEHLTKHHFLLRLPRITHLEQTLILEKLWQAEKGDW